MKIYLNAGFGHPLPEEDLKLIKDLGFNGVRQDILDRASAEPILDQLISSNLEVLAISRDVLSALAVAAFPRKGSMIELGNEEDSKQSPEEYHRWFMVAYETIRSENGYIPILTAGITTPDPKRLQWLSDVYSLGIPSDVHCGIHTYRAHTRPEKPHSGFESRHGEYNAIRRIVKSRPLHVTEIGWHTAVTKVGGFLGLGRKKVQFSDSQVADFLKIERDLAASEGVETFTVYQLNDGPDPKNHLHRYGIRRQDGSLKPSVYVARQ